jgi:hypothetical protein
MSLGTDPHDPLRRAHAIAQPSLAHVGLLTAEATDVGELKRRPRFVG